ncbi:MAG TPA: exosortase system-associated protein, TIGR04073 family [Verrucomicrobiae bacterium]|jgi:putative exosortase-associated protein (TIGR04073 family)|nr:exosortase system-associated protein, TIGR04073 family [Verrucomicrobiae bacterium]
MLKQLFLLSLIAVAGALASGCANVEQKFGRGMANTFEIVRGGELRRSMEQGALFQSPDYAYTTGFIHGLNRTLARTGIGIYEVVTAPFPPYGPVFTDHFAPGPVYPDNYYPGLLDDSLFATDTYIGYSGGDVLPFVPGSRFRVFDTH